MILVVGVGLTIVLAPLLWLLGVDSQRVLHSPGSSALLFTGKLCS